MNLANETIGAVRPLPKTFGALGCPNLHMRWLDRMEFARALAMQDEIVAKKRNDPLFEDQLLLLEHEPVYTIGRTPDRSSLLGSAHLPHPLFSINRGGQATYHGPGQLMGYPIIDLRQSARIYTNICAGWSNCSSIFSPTTTLPRSDANRSREFGSKIARSLRSASAFAIGSPCTASR